MRINLAGNVIISIIFGDLSVRCLQRIPTSVYQINFRELEPMDEFDDLVIQHFLIEILSTRNQRCYITSTPRYPFRSLYFQCIPGYRLSNLSLSLPFQLPLPFFSRQPFFPHYSPSKNVAEFRAQRYLYR